MTAAITLIKLLEEAPRMAREHACFWIDCFKDPLWAVVSEGHYCTDDTCKGDIAVLVCTTHKDFLVETTEPGERLHIALIPTSGRLN